MSESWRVAQPCSIDPATIAESGFCEQCQKTVHDLSRLTRKQALKLYKDHDGQVCGKLCRDAAGNVPFRPEPPSLLTRVSLIGISLIGAASAADGCSTEIRVQDASGAAIPNAAVTLQPKQPNATLKAWAGVSDGSGTAQAKLADGDYTLQVRAAGFKPWKREITCGDPVRAGTKVEAVLEIGEITMGLLVVEKKPGSMRRAFNRLFRR